MGAVTSTFGQLWKVLNGTRKVIVNLVFFFLLIFICILIFSEEDVIEVPDNSVLILNPTGLIVEEKTFVDPFEKFFEEALGANSDNPEVLLTDILTAISRAKSDERIGALYLDLSNLTGAGLNKLQVIGAALDDFRESGKPILTSADYYTQTQYFLAAHADKVYLTPLGGVMLDGFGYYQLYFKDMLEKLKVSSHVFKAGDYKSAVEPYTRTSMSDEAREANSELYGSLWSDFLAGIAAHRDLSPKLTSGKFDDFMEVFESVDADTAQFAIETGLVDELRTREELRAELINLTGFDEDEKSFKQIRFLSYLDATAPMPKLGENKRDKIALVHARGIIMDGTQKAGSIGGDSTAALLREARLDEHTKAVVLRIDSPGGSGFASEVIRQEVLELQKAGIPVIASMSSVAASGGYWIAASADQIWAAPTTITGSIGVFGMFFTIEDSLAEIGVNSDGFKTTEIPGLDITRPLPEGAKVMVQRSIERFYSEFVGMVAEARGMTYEAVNEVAQGRVWTGSKALELGLVDRLGNLDDAVLAAAELAQLDDYEVAPVEPDLSAKDAFMKELFGKASIWLPEQTAAPSKNLVRQSVQRVWNEVKILDQFNDPQGIYLLCDLCPTE